MSSSSTALRRLEVLADWSDDDVAQLAELGDHVDLAAGTVLVQAGVPARQAFLVVEGWATSDGPGHDGRLVSPGALLCDVEPLTGEPARATVTARTPMTVLVLSPVGVVRLRRLPAVQGWIFP